MIGLAAFPAAMQRLRVAPNEIVAERPYIERTIAATSLAYGLARIEERAFPAQEELTAAILKKNDATIKNIRLWEHRPLLDSYSQLQEIRTYYELVDVDNDRYPIDGESRQVMLSVRELSHAQALGLDRLRRRAATGRGDPQGPRAAVRAPVTSPVVLGSHPSSSQQRSVSSSA